ncbi:hypothetical protein WK09_32925 [Burkholderia ubonensis]|nr:hypothetical protein WK09_32925 [Burkholderia ubonensis]
MGDLPQRQRFGLRKLSVGVDHLIGQCARPTAFVTNQQSDYTLFSPSTSPVVDRLGAHAELRSHLGLPDFTREHQQPCRARAKFPMSVVDRQ